MEVDVADAAEAAIRLPDAALDIQTQVFRPHCIPLFRSHSICEYPEPYVSARRMLTGRLGSESSLR